MDIIDDIPSGPSYDRDFINKIFAVMFTDKYLNKLVLKGLTRDKTLNRLRGTRRHHTIKGELLIEIMISLNNFFLIALFD